MQGHNESFTLKINFTKGSENPERVFDSMSRLIGATRKTDCSLVEGLNGEVESILLLEDIEVGSLVSKVRAVLRATDDEALKSGDWKKVVGNYILKAKYAFLEKYPEDVEKLDKPSLRKIQGRIIDAAEETGASALPFYHPPSIPEIVDRIDNYQTAVSLLNPEESVQAVGRKGLKLIIPRIEGYSKETAISMLKEKELNNEIRAMLCVKKPDYLGKSRWVLVFEGKSIEAPILDCDWLGKFQNREIDVRPGDSLYSRVKVTTIYGSGSSILNIKYEVIEVLDVEREPPQGELFDTTPPSRRRKLDL